MRHSESKRYETHELSYARRSAFGVMWLKAALLLCILLTVMPFTGNRLLASTASEETLAIFKTAIDATKAIENPVTGKGVASVVTQGPTLQTMRLRYRMGASSTDVDMKIRTRVNFMFRENCSKSEISTVSEDGSTKPYRLFSVGKEHSIRYSYGLDVFLVPAPPHIFRWELGYDFSPNTFLGSNHHTLSETIELMVRGDSDLSTKMDADGKLHLIGDYRTPERRFHEVLVLDPAKGHRPAGFFRVHEEFDQPEKSSTSFVEIQWGKYDGAWYVTEARKSLYRGIHSWEMRSSLPTDKLIKMTAATITEFHPNVEIDDSAFTLAGLGLPPGKVVFDKIADRRYLLGEDSVGK